MKVLVTGAAGFIGMHTVCYLARLGFDVLGLDNLNSYYSVELKQARLRECGILFPDDNEVVCSSHFDSYRFVKMDLSDRDAVLQLFANEKFDYVIHLAAQAGVRYSVENPFAYTDSNITGFLSVLEGCRQSKVKHMIYASSSSVYGLNSKTPFVESDSTEHPISLYAATKKANEMMAHSYSHLYQIPVTGLRFFTVYGPWGRPDMALFLFTEAIINGQPVQLFNNGEMHRDFTYIEDLVPAMIKCLSQPPVPNPIWSSAFANSASSSAAYRILNVGSSRKIQLSEYIDAIEEALEKKAIRQNLPLQPGDVVTTMADTTALSALIDYEPRFSIKEGVKRFVNWYTKHYRLVNA